MNSACAIVADSMIGAVPFLVTDGYNGLIYPSGNIDKLYENVKRLILNPEERKQISLNAYMTMIKEWNANQACKNFMELVKSLNNGKVNEISQGPCSSAPIMNNNWFK